MSTTLKTKQRDTRLADLREHAQLLIEACDRFFREKKLIEIRNIGVRLRVLVGSGAGSGLLFELASETGDSFQILALTQFGTIKVTEIEPVTQRVIQQIERRALITTMPGRLPIAFVASEESLYKNQDLRDWIETGFLLDWEVPDDKGATPAMKRFTPQVLINRYAGQESAHSDASHGTFGGPVEAFTMEYAIRDERVVVPVVYEYLAQIGQMVGRVAIDYANQHSPGSPLLRG